MNFGEKLKKLRQLQNLSQPELAASIGIEQSYLSKLENDKSIPSAEMLNRILEALDITLDEFLVDVDDDEIRKQLGSIPQVVDYAQTRQVIEARNRNRWLVVSAIFVALGAGLLASGSSGYLFPEIAFNYQSSELVPKGSNGEIFENLDDFLNYKFAPIQTEMIRNGSDEFQIETARELFYLGFMSLKIPEYLLRYENQGIAYTTDVVDASLQAILAAVGVHEGATRTFKLHHDQISALAPPRAQNGQIKFAGISLLLLGTIGLWTLVCRFFAEYLLYRRGRGQLT